MQIKNEFVRNGESSLIISEPCNQSQSQNHKKNGQSDFMGLKRSCNRKYVCHLEGKKKLNVDLMKPLVFAYPFTGNTEDRGRS